MTTSVCVKVKELRKNGYQDLESWMSDPDNLYVGRRGRIWITDPVTKEKKIFHYSDSKWANPYKVGDKPGQYTLEKSIDLYKDHLIASNLIDDIDELEGKRLGCFCLQNKPCHAQVLVELFDLTREN